jgi:hypothetical protein
MKTFKFIIIIFFGFLHQGCKNVVLKNIKTNTVQVAKLDILFELGDTIFYNNAKYEIIRKKLRNGNIVMKQPVIKPSLKKEATPIPPPSRKP